MRPADHAVPGAAPSKESRGLLHEHFERAADRWPERIAVDVPPGEGRPVRRTVSYAELEAMANRLAAALGPAAAGERVVPILLSRDSEVLYAAQLAVLKAGAAYTCIDPSFPDAQARSILEDCASDVLLTDAAGLERSRRAGFPVARSIEAAEASRSAGASPSRPRPPPWLSGESLAYVIYTSGTTGAPKGVMVEHGSAANLVRGDLEEFGLSPEDRVAQSSSAAYDSSVEEIWLALAAGAALVVLDDRAVRLGPDLIAWLRRERVTVFCPPPTLLRAASCGDPETALPDLSLLYVGGEALPSDVAERWARGRRLVNGYGPTECTVTALRGRIRPGEPVHIGRPVPGAKAWVLDDALRRVPAGGLGELCIGGTGLARGYRNRPDLTRGRFIEHPELGRVYRTGDLVHESEHGLFFYHGRIDSQVKLRGYRIELEAVEARLAEIPGVLQAACVVQGNGAREELVAFIVPDPLDGNPPFDRLKAALRGVLPAYMVPSRFAALAELPRTVGGKIDRKSLPPLAGTGERARRPISEPRDPLEEKVAAAIRRVLRTEGPVSIDDHFFDDLGGDSLGAAELVSALREDPMTATVAVRDVYEAPTAAELAARLGSPAPEAPAVRPAPGAPRGGKPILATAVQAAWIALEVVVAAPVAWAVAFHAIPFLVRSLGMVAFVAVVPLLGFAARVAWAPVAVLLAMAAKAMLIGRYRPTRQPVWGSYHVRAWIVQQVVRLVPWRLISGTEFQCAALRALGARIGRRVHIGRDVDVQRGGWDLLEIGDDASVGRDAFLGLVDFERGELVVDRVVLGARSTVDTRGTIGGGATIEPEGFLTALSLLPPGARLPSGERWDGVPARPAGLAPPAPPLPAGRRSMSPAKHGISMVLAELASSLVIALPFEVASVAVVLGMDIGAERFIHGLYGPGLDPAVVLGAVLVAIVPLPFAVTLRAYIARALGRLPEGVVDRWSPAWILAWLKTGLVESAGAWLSGSLFWPAWLRAAGMKVGRGCEISTIMEAIPELVEIGSETFFADGIYLGGATVHRGTATLGRTVLGPSTFIGNHAVIPPSQTLPGDILVGICTVAEARGIREGTSWFGHPPFELPRREVVECDRRLTHDPPLIRRVNRLLWETARFGLPIVPAALALAWVRALTHIEAHVPPAVHVLAAVPALGALCGAILCLVVLALKWALLGRVRPGIHPLWSCWCSRWDFLYVAWARYAKGLLSALEGTLLLAWYLRAMGATIGRRVVLGRGFSQVVDPDMLHFEDEATVTCQFQAHTFEDRVLKIDRVRIGRRATVGDLAVLLYGADVGEEAQVASMSVVMKRERLLPRRSYEGCPTRPVP